MLVDLHAHFPMHVPLEADRHTHRHVLAWSRRRWQARVVSLISRFANYQGPGGTPSVTEALMREGDVGVILSVLYAPFAEMDLTEHYGAPPRPGYFADLMAELDSVEDFVSARSQTIAVARSPAALGELRTSGRIALVHCIEGGFHLGSDPAEIAANVKTLAERGVAYVTISHLFWRNIATNAPALPFLKDWMYRRVFPQPSEGLSPLGAAAVEAMLDHGVLIDISHMSEKAVQETLALLDRRDPDRRVPVVATHAACRFGSLEYCLPDETIRLVAARGGVLGCILSKHYITDGLQRRLNSYKDSVNALCRHIDRIGQVTGSLDHVGIGSDLDGYIKPALPGLEHMGHMAALQRSLRHRYGAADAEKIISGNALRVLQAGWRGA